MAKSVVIREVTYNSVPSVTIPLASGSGEAEFFDTSGANVTGADVRNGKKAYGPSGEITGSMVEKTAQTYTPGTSDQTINANQYLAGAQTIKGDANLQPANIVAGKSIFGIGGTAQIPIIVQDSTSKVLSIS